MAAEKMSKRTAAQVLKKYTEDDLPMFLGHSIDDVNQLAADGDRPIHVACVRGSSEDVLALIEGGADINAAGDLGFTPLHHAASRGLVEIAKALLTSGADVTARNEFGQMPIDLARLESRSEIVEILESAKRARS